MTELLNKITRPSRKLTDQLIITAFLAVFVVMSLGVFLSNILFRVTDLSGILGKLLGSDNLTVFLSDYLSFFGIWVAVLIFVLIPKANRPMLKAWGYNKRGNNMKGIGWGLLLGFGTNAFCVLMSVLMGDIKLSFFGFQPGILLLFLIAVFIQSGAEELINRLYMYQKLRRRYRSPLVAILGNALLFMGLHVFNPGFGIAAGSQILLIGVIFSVIVYYYDSLWCAIWFHAAWNYTQNIIFGLPNSGIVSEYSIFKLEAASATSGLFYEVNFGVEGSIGSSLILLAVLIVIILRNRNKPERKDYWADAERRTLENYPGKYGVTEEKPASDI